MSWCFWMMDGESNKETWTQRSELMFGQRKPVCFSSPLRRAGPTTVSPRSFHRPNLNTEMGRRDWVLSWHAALHPDAADWPAEWPRLICLREEKVSNLLLDAARKRPTASRILWRNHVWSYVNRRLASLLPYALAPALSSQTIGL